MLLSTFIIQYYSEGFFFFLIAYYLNKIIIIDMCEQFIVVTSYDELIINKVYNKYAIIYIQHSPKKKKKHRTLLTRATY